MSCYLSLNTVTVISEGKVHSLQFPNYIGGTRISYACSDIDIEMLP